MRPFLSLLLVGIVLAGLSLAVALWGSLPETVFAQQQCFDAGGCDDAIASTVLSTVLRSAPSFFAPGVVSIALALALAARRGTGRTTEGNPPVNPRPLLVLWVLGSALTVLALVMIAVQSQPMAGGYGMSCDSSGCTASPDYTLRLFLGATAPGMLLAGLLALVIALAVRAVGGRAAHPVPTDGAEAESATAPAAAPADGLAELLEGADEPTPAAPAGLGGLRMRRRREDLSVYMRPADPEER